MFKLKFFDEQICELGNSYDLIADACRDQDDIFSFQDTRAIRPYKRAVINFLKGEMNGYPFFHWVIFVFSWYGTVSIDNYYPISDIT